MTLNRRAEVPSKLSNKVQGYMMLHGAIPCSSHSKAYTISFYLPRLYSLIFLGTAAVSRMNKIGQQSREQVHQLPLETSIVQNCAPSFNTLTISQLPHKQQRWLVYSCSSLLLQRLASLAQLLLKSQKNSKGRDQIAKSHDDLSCISLVSKDVTSDFMFRGLLGLGIYKRFQKSQKDPKGHK